MSNRETLYCLHIKRLIDLTVALLVLALSLPLLLVIAVAVYRDLGAPVLFRQPRLGRAGQLFVINKFRTMHPYRAAEGRRTADGARLTRLGAWLRRTQLDKLPELWNVVRGEMSLVGPRPLLTTEFEPRSLEQWHRHRVRPGMTGWTEVEGRDRGGWVERFNHDARYVAECSFSLDCRIIARSLRHMALELVRRPRRGLRARLPGSSD